MKKSTLIKISAFGVSLIGVSYMAVSKKLFDDCLKNNQPSKAQDSTDYSGINQLIDEVTPWFENIEKKEVKIKSHDDLLLNGHLLHHPNSKKYVILIHGYKSTIKTLYYHAYNFYQAGYNILLIDQRSHGASDGDYLTLGYLEAKDVSLWIDYLIALCPSCIIGMLGVSMGGATVANISGYTLPLNVKWIIEDCGFSSIENMLLDQANRKYNFDHPIMLKGFSLLCKLKNGFTLKKADYIKQVEKSKTPILFIHGDQDEFVPVEMCYQLFEAAKCHKDIFIAEGQGHLGACLDPHYFKTVFNFIYKYE